MPDQALLPPTDDQLVDALAEIVDEAIAYKIRKEKADEARFRMPSFRSYSATELLSTDQSVLREISWVEDPVYRALKRGATELGEIIHGRIGNAGMVEMAEGVCDRDEANWHARMSFVDSAFNGIGSWYS